MKKLLFQIKRLQRIGFRLVAVVALLVAIPSRAEDANSLFNQANKLYEQGKFSEASAMYGKMVQTGSASTAVYFNLGNAFLKSGQMGRAIVAYRSAEKLSPRDPDVRANLQFARDQIGKTVQSKQRWQNWLGRLTLNEWTIATSIAVSLWFLLLAIRQLKPDWKKSFRNSLLLLGTASAFLIVCLGSAIYYEAVLKWSVVIVPEAVVRRGPLEESQSAFTLRDGAEITVLDRKGDWLQIADAAQRSGWLPQKQTLEIGKF